MVLDNCHENSYFPIMYDNVFIEKLDTYVFYMAG